VRVSRFLLNVHCVLKQWLGEPSLVLLRWARACSLRQSYGYDCGREHAHNASVLRDVVQGSTYAAKTGVESGHPANSCKMRVKANTVTSMTITVKEILADAVQKLQHLDTAGLDAQILLAYVLQTSRETLFAHPEKVVTEGHAANYQSLISKRIEQYPVAYLTGRREFWSMDLIVSQDTLIPRPETELLVETALEMIPVNTPLNILDVGTGSGAIALAIATERPQCRIMASDVSPEALAVTRSNAIRYGLRNIDFRVSDWFSAFSGEVFDLVVCNPPYVDSHDRAFNTGEIRYEPRIALDGGYLGMKMINFIIPGALEHLKPDAQLILEHGYDQGESIRYLFITNKYIDISTRVDYSGRERVTAGRKPL